MKSRPPLLARLWRKLFPAAPPAPVRLSSTERPLPNRDRLRERAVEPLEGRIAPAVLLPNGVDVQYHDLDGDLVTIHFSKSLFTAPPGGTVDVDATLAAVFTFSTGKAHTGGTDPVFDAPQQLQTIDLTKVRPSASTTPATGVSFSVTAQKVDNNGTLVGDGVVNVGAISAGGITLGSVSIGGDLGQIDAGLSTSAVAIQALTVKTLGKLTNTQAGTATYESTITGGIGSFTADSIVGGYLHVTGSTAGGTGGTAAVGNIGTVTIAHQIASRDSANASAANDGRLEVSGKVGTLIVGSGFRDAAHPELSDGLYGGAGPSSGTINISGQVTKLLIKGDLRGSTGTSSASIAVGGTVGALEVDGSLLGLGTSSASITASTTGTLVIGVAGGHGLVGGTGDGSAVVKIQGAITLATIADIEGSGSNSGGLTATGAITSVTVNGYVKGGASANSGFVHSDTLLGTVKLLGDLQGGAGAKSGVVTSSRGITSFSGASILGAEAGVAGSGLDSGGVAATGKIGSVTLSGSLVGGFGEHSGFIESDFSIATITIKGNVEGRSGVRSGSIITAGSLGTVNITGHLQGGDPVVLPAVGTTPAFTNSGDLSGSISAGLTDGSGITSITIGGGLIGGASTGSGVVSAFGTIGTVKITRLDAMGNRLDAIAGGAGDASGVVYSFGNITTVTVNGNILGGAGAHSGRIEGHALKTVTVSGNLSGSTGEDSGTLLALDSGTPGDVHAAGSFGTVKVLGTVTGGNGLRSGVISSDGAITSLSVGGLFQGVSATSGRIVSGAGLYGPGNIGTLSLGQVGSASLTGGAVLAYGAVGTLTTGNVISGTIHVQDSITSFSVNGALTNSTITAGGQAVFNGKTDLAIGSIAIKGNVTNSSIKAGYGIFNDAENGHAQIGAVTVTGNWIASNLVAGVQDAGTSGFGDAGDQLISGNTSKVKARIASVMITGNVDTAGTGQFGFVAQEIGSFHSSRGTLALNATVGQFFNYAGTTGGTVSIREVLPV